MAKDLIFKNLIFSEGKNILIISILTFFVLFIAHTFLKTSFPKISFILLLVSLFCIIFLLFSFYFFRNPDRKLEKIDQDILICPADGKIIDIVQGDFDGFDQKVSIFLSPLDVHVNWISMTGKIVDIKYKAGQFIAAFVPKSSIFNERNDIVIQDSKNRSILLRQIAGTVARRIVCWLKIGQDVKIGQKYGMIKFSSRVDILLPKNVSLNVKLNQKVLGGNTILGRWV